MMSQGLILIDALSSACWELKKKKRIFHGDFCPGWDTLYLLCFTGFSQLLDAIKG
jgi:hypothetical protein